MRLLYCQLCEDAFRLTRSLDDRHCDCGRSFGRLDERGKIVAGGPFNILGVNGSSLRRAIQTTPRVGDGARFYAFVMPTECPAVQREDLLATS